MTATLAGGGSPQAATTATPRAQRVVMFADSVGLGARAALPRAFPAGWEVNVDGQPARFVEQLENDFVKPRLASDPDWFGDHVVIAGGYNYPYWDPERFDRSIDSIIGTLTAAGVEHIHWVTLREVDPQYISGAAWRQIQPYQWYFPTVNDHLEHALARHPDLRLVDWAAVADQPGLTYDAIHLNTTGAALYSQIIRDDVDAARSSVPDGSTTRIVVPGASGDAAVAINITTVAPRTRGHLRVWDCVGDPPGVSMHSYARGQTVAHAAIVPLDARGTFCVFARTSTNLVVDATATFTAAAGLVPAVPTRLFDTRSRAGETGGAPLPAGATTRVPVAATDQAPAAIAVTATALGGTERGWVRLARCSRIAGAATANINHPAGLPTPNLAVVRPDADGDICATNRTGTHLIVDRFATFTDPDMISIDDPARWLDTRTAAPGTPGPLPPGTVTALDLADARPAVSPAGAAPGAVIVNITSVDAATPGYVTAYPCDRDRPATANLNTAGGIVSNTAIVPVGADSTICLFNRSAMHLVVDLMGTIDAAALGRDDPTRLLDTRR